MERKMKVKDAKKAALTIAIALLQKERDSITDLTFGVTEDLGFDPYDAIGQDRVLYELLAIQERLEKQLANLKIEELREAQREADRNDFIQDNSFP